MWDTGIFALCITNKFIVIKFLVENYNFFIEKKKKEQIKGPCLIFLCPYTF